MSLRPRLVEEGKPIDQTNQQTTDEFLESEYQKALAQQEHLDQHPATTITHPKSRRDRHRDHRPQQQQVDPLGTQNHLHYYGESTRDHFTPSACTSLSSLRQAAANIQLDDDAPKQRRQVLQTKIEIGNSVSSSVVVPARKLITKFEIGAMETTTKERNERRKYSDDSSSSWSMMDVEPSGHHTDVVASRSDVMGGVKDEYELYEDQSERMEIDDTHLQRLPLVVLDGANVAYAYTQATTGTIPTSSSSGYLPKSRNGIQPNVLGIDIAVSYFLNGGCRVQVVVPVYWMRRKPTNGESSNNHIDVSTSSQLAILNRLKEQNILCCSPPTDDDDAYCISIARRIDARFQARRKTSSSLQSYALAHFSSSSCDDDLTRIGGAYILSNDLFRDAQDRDVSGELTRWLNGNSGEGEFNIPRRISYSFADLGSMDKYGDGLLDFVPNPRHPLVAMIERSHRNHGSTY